MHRAEVDLEVSHPVRSRAVQHQHTRHDSNSREYQPEAANPPSAHHRRRVGDLEHSAQPSSKGLFHVNATTAYRTAATGTHQCHLALLSRRPPPADCGARRRPMTSIALQDPAHFNAGASTVGDLVAGVAWPGVGVPWRLTLTGSADEAIAASP